MWKAWLWILNFEDVTFFTDFETCCDGTIKICLFNQYRLFRSKFAFPVLTSFIDHLRDRQLVKNSWFTKLSRVLDVKLDEMCQCNGVRFWILSFTMLMMMMMLLMRNIKMMMMMVMMMMMMQYRRSCTVVSSGNHRMVHGENTKAQTKGYVIIILVIVVIVINHHHPRNHCHHHQSSSSSKLSSSSLLIILEATVVISHKSKKFKFCKELVEG